MKVKNIIGGIVSSFVVSTTANAIVVNAENNATTLANNIAGAGVTISNISYTGAAGATGTFSDGLSSGVGIDEGIMISTGMATDAVGPNASASTSTDFGTAGYAPLTALAGVTTYDAAILSFDFEFDGGNGGDLFFNMVFGSEEYNEYVNAGVNDTFAFFLDGVNVALLPDTSAISIDTVNLGANAGLYNDNESGIHDIEFDGFTDVLQISSLGLSAGLHTMEFAIADGGDSIYDSWIMLQSGSFSSEDPSAAAEPGSLALIGLGLAGIGFSRRKMKS